VYPLELIRARLSDHRPTLAEPGPEVRQAAVAIILREESKVGPEVLLIRRADKVGDPWSGQMAFPGGHRDAGDIDLRAAAVRETHEEVGVDLRHARYLGHLHHQAAAPRGRNLRMIIAPHIFELEAPVAPSPNHEVAEVVWTPLGALASGSLHTAEQFAIGGTPSWFNGYRLPGGHFVWGLTYRMLKTLFGVLDPSWQPPPER
jgi:8-oxo-dGTP pyrophosphatase MutT (NUDIX family)